jgi:methyl-accepting chemotaxis protein
MTADRLEQEQRRAQEIRQQEMRKLAQVFETGVKTMIDQLSQKTIEIKETADHLAQNASATVQRSNEVAAATHEMSGNMQAVAAATEELTGSVSEIGRQVNQSTQSTRNAVVQVVNTDKVVHTLSETSAQIGEIVNLIRGIAGQTNLLALNANIESARAGQAGDGFRVVASEVKQLANQTAKATDEIETQITSMKEAAGSSVLSITDIRKTITMIDELFDQIAGAVRAQGEAIGEIASNIHQATQGSTRVSVNISSVNQSVEETGSMAQAVQQAVSEQEAQFIKLRKEVDSFIKTVLSA